MADRVTLIAEEAGDVVLATSPSFSGGTALLTALFGIDGVNIGSDEDGDALTFPVAMTEGAPGVYGVVVVIEEAGPYFAKFTVDGVVYGPVIVMVKPTAAQSYDVVIDVATTLPIVARSNPTSINVTITDREGTAVGSASDGTPYTWPQTASQVPGHTDCWYFDDVVFDEGGKMHIAMVGPTGPVWNDVIEVFQAPQGVASHFNGWQPDAAYAPADWISIGTIRRLTGWPASTVPDRTIRELRRMAVETFIERTNRWIPPWTGTWHGLRGQGRCLYLPVPVLLAQDGAEADPEVVITEPFGEQMEVETLNADELAWRVRGQYARQPFAERDGTRWDPTLDVKITGSFGSVGMASQVPLRVQQCIVGLIRWHSLSYGVGPDEARDAATLNRITTESSRERSVAYHESAISTGITGDPVVDRILAEYTINPGPWVVRNGDR